MCTSINLNRYIISHQSQSQKIKSSKQKIKKKKQTKKKERKQCCNHKVINDIFFSPCEVNSGRELTLPLLQAVRAMFVPAIMADGPAAERTGSAADCGRPLTPPVGGRGLSVPR
jgi:hypothetical protein